ncbi:hypothetical protein HN451_06785 [archaeon]|nr:hypothetical protein [archaeon]
MNNRIAREFNEQTKDVSNILKKNFKILKALQERNSETISLIRLNKEGFNLQFHTHQMFDSELNKPILFTYCLGLIEIKQKHYELREFTIR